MEFDINKLYEISWGYRGLPFPLGGLKQFDNPLGNIKQLGSALKYSTPLGTKLFMPMAIGVSMPNEPTVSVEIRKHIVQTALVGSQELGTVKELISTEDYHITIRGIMLGETTAFPTQEVQALNNLFLKNEALKIEHLFLETLGIERLVIMDFYLPEMVGIQNAQAYEINAISDGELILTIEE